MLSRSVRQRIGSLLREEARARPKRKAAGTGATPASGHTATGATARRPRATAPDLDIIPAGIDEILPGGVIAGREGSIFVHERLYTELREKPAPLLKKLTALAAGPPPPGKLRRRARDLPEAVAEATGAPDDPAGWERALFRNYGHHRMLLLDIETCGLSAAPVFLVGLCHVGERNLVLRQLFARDYSEERALVAQVAAIARDFDFLVTFNGRTFDIPFLRDRATHHRLRFGVGLPHLDLLQVARRRWRGQFRDCRLQTLEWHILRRRRAGDVDGAAIPGIYHDYVKRGQPHRLLPVFHHNLLDLVAMAELLPHALAPGDGSGPARGRRWEEEG
jgi:uncharacterized protein YprB with RNaseH-like and TPR domain